MTVYLDRHIILIIIVKLIIELTLESGDSSIDSYTEP